MPYNKSQTKKHVVCNRASLCVLLLVPILLAREYKLCRFARTCIIPPSRPRGRSHSQCYRVVFPGAVTVISTFSSFWSCVRLPRQSPCMYVYKNHQTMRYRDECMPLVSSVDTVYIYDLRVAHLNNRRNDFSPCFFCRKCVPCILVHPPPIPCSNSQTKNMWCVIKHRCVCSKSYLYYLHESINYVDLPEHV